MAMSPAEKTSYGRIAMIDALRGLAVALMVQQHLGVWLWKEPMMPVWSHFIRHPFMVGCNLTGLLAAPLFVTLAGFGAELTGEKFPRSGRMLARRGIAIILAGYLLNLATPHWFTPFSWFVLHLIGFSLLLAPLLLRLPAPALLLLYPFVFALTALVQNLLGTPLLLLDARMGSASLPGGIARLALAEGNFPVLPWLALFISGMLAARVRKTGRIYQIAVAGLLLIAAGIALGLLYRHGYAFATRGAFFRLFVAVPYFYPAFPPIMLTLNGTALLLLSGFLSMKGRGAGAFSLLAPLGRASLTVLVVHIVIFNEVTRLLHLHRAFPGAAAMGIIAATLIIFAVLCGVWRRYDYRYGLEWLVRRGE